MRFQFPLVAAHLQKNFQANDCLLITSRGTKLPGQSKRWLKKHGAKLKTISNAEIQRLAANLAQESVHEEFGMSESSAQPPPLRLCQQAAHFADSILATALRLRRINMPPVYHFLSLFQACLEACANGARVIQMACGTGKTRVIQELARNVSGQVAWHDV